MNIFVIILAVCILLCSGVFLSRVFRSCDVGKGAAIVLPLSGHMESVELQVRGLVSSSRGIRGAVVLLADFGADAETAEIAQRLCRDFAVVDYVKGADLTVRVEKLTR